MASVLDQPSEPITLAGKVAEYKNMSEKELLAIIAENSRRTKGYVQAISILVLLDLCVAIALGIAAALQAS